jgi:5-deoxy-D-glucuronate isomerase
MKKMIAALAACALLPAMAQSTSYTPSEREAQQSRENTARIAKLADSMEKARLKEEAKPTPVYIPKEKPVEKIAEHKVEVFTAKAPVDKKKPAKKKKHA